MPDFQNSKRNIQSIVKYIKRSRKERTILFSDIVHSTRFWAAQGDIKGRLMVDRHNWLLFPVIKHFKGRIVKTIGDAILAVFKESRYAVQAAIAMQQILQWESETNPDFCLKIRIGIHSGETIVEHHDVFGDVVNIASRIESKGKGREIILSSETKKRLMGQALFIKKKGGFVPRGKKQSIDIYQCQWQKSPDLIGRLKLHTKMPLIPKQRYEILMYTLVGLAAVFLLINFYLRFFLSEFENISLVMLSPSAFLFDYPLLLLPCLALLGGLGWLIYTILKMKTIPITAFRITKGGFGFLILFTLAYFGLSHVPGSPGRHLQGIQYESKHLLVKTLGEHNLLYDQPSLQAQPVKTLNAGRLLLLADVKSVGPIVWNKVLIARETYGWIPRVLPPRLGVPVQRVTLTDKFYFRNRDIYALLLGLAGFAWGFFTFHIRPA
ncbi:adenylate/guanylate cyclase domain-containing protein [bacterium]|nr:adenylate/guanylate cyclase domain-containing protein [bacterium]